MVLWLVVCLVVVLGPGLASIVTPFELWPWTNAPMFAHSPVSGTRQLIDFTVVKADGRRVPFDSRRAAGFISWHLHRSFLLVAWGADAADSPFGHVDADTPERRRERITRWFNAIVDWNRKKKPPKKVHGKRTRQDDFVDVVAIEVGLTPLHVPGPRRVLGTYDIATRRFSSTAP